MRQVWGQAKLRWWGSWASNRASEGHQIQLSIICKVNHSRWEQKGEHTHMSKDRTRVPQLTLKTGGRVPAVLKQELQRKWTSSVVNSTDTIHSWHCYFFSLSSLQIWPLMTQWNTFCCWTRHWWTIVWLTVLAGAVFSNYPFSTVEHFQPCCLHLSLCASRRPHSLILILLMKCNFRIMFFLREHHLIEDTRERMQPLLQNCPH